MTQIRNLISRIRGTAPGSRIRPLTAGLILAVVSLMLASAAFGAQGDPGQSQMKAPPVAQIFTFFFLMLGPIKIIGPFVKATHGADAVLARRIAVKATFYAAVGLLLAALLGQSMLAKYAIPLPVLTLAGGLILFLVALQTILQQFAPPGKAGGEAPAAPSMSLAMSPIAFPTIVTPYGIAALIIFVALSPTLEGRLSIGLIALVIMALDLVAMLLARHILRFLGVFLQLLGAVLGIIQVALGLDITLSALKSIWV